MSNVIQLPVIAGVEITTDAEGRFNLNALHRASGGAQKNRPGHWLALDSTKALIDEMGKGDAEIPVSATQQTAEIPAVSVSGRNSGDFSNSEDSRLYPVKTKEGRSGGTFTHELLAVSYAGWISPAFQLQVNQTFIDYRTGKLQQPAIPQTLPEALRYAAELAEANQAMKPKVEALDRIATSDGSLCITNAAKDLQMRPKDLFRWCHANRWIYRRPGGQGWIAYQDRLQRGDMEHKVTTVSRSDGSEKTVEQVRVTPKGLARLAERLKPMEDIA